MGQFKWILDDGPEGWLVPRAVYRDLSDPEQVEHTESKEDYDVD